MCVREVCVCERGVCVCEREIPNECVKEVHV